MLNKSKGNMYPWVTHTWNPISGKCSHECIYCYMKGYPLRDVNFKETRTQEIGKGKKIFVGSSTDMWADDVPSEWISEVLLACRKYPQNEYLFQTKNPKRFLEFVDFFPPHTILGTTLETNRNTYLISKAPTPESRAWIMRSPQLMDFEKMVSIEPIIDFDVNEFVMMVDCIKPDFVSVGADSKGHNLNEPNPKKIRELIDALEAFTEVKLKDNLRRLYDDAKT